MSATHEADKASLQSNIDTEIARATAAETELNNNIISESTARALADSKIVFLSQMEAEGVLELYDFPFASGFGSPSKANFGLYVPFESTVLSFSISQASTNTGALYFELFHYDLSSNATSVFVLQVVGNASISHHEISYSEAETPVVFPPGNYCIKVGAKSGLLTDVDARYRSALYINKSI